MDYPKAESLSKAGISAFLWAFNEHMYQSKLKYFEYYDSII